MFDTLSPIERSDPYRADIACFVGFVARRRGRPIPGELRRWLEEAGWWSGPYARPSARKLRDVPIPIDSWESFDRLFAWERRRLDRSGRTGATYLGAAVRSFFAEGGRKCYVVRLGAPWHLTDARTRRLTCLECIIPGYPYSFSAVAEGDRASWRGIGHLFGLPDVSMLCVPDLPDACGVEPPPLPPIDEPPPPEEQFVECSAPVKPPPPDSKARFLSAPRCSDDAYLEWAHALHLVATFVARRNGEVQLVASLPIPLDGSMAERSLRDFLTARGSVLAIARRQASPGLASAFVQLAYPWVRTGLSNLLPEGVEPPEGVLAGLLAQSGLTRGAYRSAAGSPSIDAYDVFPEVPHEQLTERRALRGDPPMSGLPLHERVSVFGHTAAGLRLLSDVTTSTDEAYRPASVNRLVSLVVRAARIVGEESVFEPSGERLWTELRERLNTLLLELYRAGALSGSGPGDAFTVRCDRSTTTQDDLDHGRVIVEIQITPTAPIETIRIVLAMDEQGQISLAGGAATQDAA